MTPAKKAARRLAGGPYVLRADNGQEVFRRYFPKYNRSEVRFLTGEFFAYSDGRTVRVLRVPPRGP